MSQGPEKLRAAEKGAKEQKKRMWKDYKQSESPLMNIKERNYTAKVNSTKLWAIILVMYISNLSMF